MSRLFKTEKEFDAAVISTIKETLAAYEEALGMSSLQLAKEAGVPYTSYLVYKHGTSAPSLGRLCALSGRLWEIANERGVPNENWTIRPLLHIIIKRTGYQGWLR